MSENELYRQAIRQRALDKIEELTKYPEIYWQKYYGKSSGDVTKELAQLHQQTRSMNGLNGPRNQFELNNEIEALVPKLKASTIQPQQKEFIRQYTGSGGLASKGATGEGLLYEFYTPAWLADRMAKLAYAHGFKDGGKILEPSIATGELIRPFVWNENNAPKKNHIVGFEINPTSADITKLLYTAGHPAKLDIYKGYFEEAFLEYPRFTRKLNTAGTKSWLGNDFDLVIGNPPFGIYQNKYSAYFNKKLYKQIEIFFILQSIHLLKPGGLLAFLQSSNFLSNGDKYQYAKEEIGKYAELIDAYRLPKIFATSDVPTDIMILKKY